MYVAAVGGRFHRLPSRSPLAGRGALPKHNGKQKSFDEYLLEAFQGKVIKNGPHYHRSLSSLTRENLIRLGEQSS